MQRYDWAHGVIVVLAVAVVIAVSLMMGLASAFLIPLVLVASGCGLLFYWALRHQGVRNPMAPKDFGAMGRWADGQPVERAEFHDAERLSAAKEVRQEAEDIAEKVRRYEVEREVERGRSHPRDFQGPPPVVPFP
jgi:hypothetical protein